MKINLLAVAPISVAVLVLAGCGGSSSAGASAPVASAPAATTAAAQPSATTDDSTTASAPAPASGPAKPKGFTLAVDQKNGYQLAVPSGFKRIKKKSDLDKVMKAGKKALSGKGLGAQLDNETLKMLAVNPATGNAINVVVNGAGGVTSDQLPAMRSALKQQAQQIGGSGIGIKTAELGGEPANRLAYVLAFQGRKVTTVQYITVHSDKVYTLTFSEPLKISAATEKKTIESWRFL